jgi:predicted Zn-dependent protease
MKASANQESENMLITELEAQALCEKLMSFVQADDAEVSVGGTVYSQLRFAANQFTTSGKSADISAGVTVWIDKKRASVSTNEIDDASLRAAVEQAQQNARISPVDREYLPTLGPQQYTPVQGFAAATASISEAARARTISDVIALCEKEKVSGAGFHQARATAGAARSKNGCFRYSRSSNVSLSCTARTPDGTGSGYFLRSHFDVARLDTSRIAREAIRKALASRQPRTLDAGTYSVVLEPQAVADLLGFFAFFFDARSADEGRSPFSAPGGKTRVGERIVDERINVYSDPWHPELPGSPFAQGGLPARKLYLIRNGVLETLAYSRFWAQQKKTEPTPGPVNSIMESSAAPVSVEEMVKNMKKGLLVGRFWYIRPVDPRTALLTGLTRDGVWYIENGAIQHPVRNFRFNQSILQMLAPGNVEAVGKAERVGSSEGQGGSAGLLPALMLKSFNFTSQSEAV